MKRRWRLWVVLILLLVCGLLLLYSVRWPIYGWLRGEAFYQGMPTSYWHSEIIEVNDEETWAEQLLERLGRSRTDFEFCYDLVVPSALLDNDPAKIPVLKQLLHTDDIEVQVIAAILLRKQLGGKGTDLIMPVLLQGAECNDTDVRKTARETLKAIDPDGAAKGKYE